MVPEKRAQERSVRESEEILNPLRLFDAALVLVSDEAASPALDEYADSGEGGQAFHLKADSESGRWRTAFR